MVGWWVAHEILMSAQGPLVLSFWVLGLGTVHIFRLLPEHLPGRPNYDQEWSIVHMWKFQGSPNNHSKQLSIVKDSDKAKAFKELVKRQKEHSKGKEICYRDLSLQNYL